MTILENPQITQVISKALHDSAFRHLLLREPKQALQLLEITIPDHQAVMFLQSTKAESFLVLPAMTETEVNQLEAAITSPLPLRSLRAKILLQALQEDDFKSRLLAKPADVLREAGMEIPTDLKVTVLENTAEQAFFVLPCTH